jgi:hypothetical protein
VEWRAPFPGKYAVCVQLVAAAPQALPTAAAAAAASARADVAGTPFIVTAAQPPPRAPWPRTTPAPSPRTPPHAAAPSPPREAALRRQSSSPSPRCLSGTQFCGGPSPSAAHVWDRSGEPPLAWEVDVSAEAAGLSPQRRAVAPKGRGSRPAWVD